MITIPSLFDQKDPRETCVLTFDATAMLASGETLTSVGSTSITTTIGADSTPALVLSNEIVNGTALTLLNGKTVAAGCAVQAIATAGNFSSVYWIAITCPTSNPEKVLTLKASLPMAQM